VAYTITYTESARQQLRALPANQRRLVLDAIDEQLSFEPMSETRNRKRMSTNRLAPWELRVGDMRVFYDVVAGGASDEPDTVQILAIGRKEGNRLFIGGKEVKL
jgi:mRNA-degrading endonuclease RelE of RelBE toxin-antitoxin system